MIIREDCHFQHDTSNPLVTSREESRHDRHERGGEVVTACVSSWFGSLEAFERCCQGEVLEALAPWLSHLNDFIRVELEVLHES